MVGRLGLRLAGPEVDTSARGVGAGRPKLVVPVAGTVLAAEYLHWQAARRYLPGASPPEGPGGTGVIVLGHRPRRDGTIHPLARWRVQMAERAFRLLHPQVIVFTGGAHSGQPTEASIMAANALEAGIPARVLRTEEASGNTWENIAFSLPLVEHCSRLAVVSDPMHAARGRRNLVAQRPDLAERLVSGGDYRFLERWWLKVPTAAYELPKVVKPGLTRPASSGLLSN